MSPFLHTMFLWFLPLAAIPVLLHLLTLYRIKTVELSTFRFLFDSYVQQRRRMKFIEILLAILRTLFLLLLILAIARPMMRHWNNLFGLGGGQHVVFMLDCSASMNANTDGVTSLDRAKMTMHTVIDRLAPEDRLTLVTVTSRPRELFTRFISDQESIREQIDSIEVTPSRGNFFAGLDLVFGAGSEIPESASVFVFTDSQQSGWDEVVEQGTDALVPATTSITLVNVGTKLAIDNLAIVAGPPEPAHVIAGLPFTFHPKVLNDTLETRDVPLKIFLDDREVMRTTLRVGPGETIGKEIIHSLQEPGVVAGRFEIEDDRFPDDNTYLFSIGVIPQVKVLIVNGRPHKDPFEDESLYLTTALSTTPEQDDEDLGPGTEFVQSLSVSVIQERELNFDRLSDSDVIMLANCGRLNDRQYSDLRDFVYEGGGLVIFPGDRVNREAYNKRFFPVPGPQNETLTAVVLGEPIGDPEGTDNMQRFAALDLAHPVFAPFADPDEKYFAKVHFTRFYPLDLPEGNQAAWPLAQFSSGDPALVENRFGNGHVIVAAFPATTKWSNFPLKPEFVPFILQLMSHVEQSVDVVAPSVVKPDQPAEIKLPLEWQPASGTITNEAGISAPLEFSRSASRLVAAYDQTSSKGFYRIAVKSERGDRPRSDSGFFAVNLDSQESSFVILNEADLSELFAGQSFTYVDASAEAQQLYGMVGNEQEIWRPLIIGMFLIIAIEFMLATLGGHVGPGDEQRTMKQRIKDLNPVTVVENMTGTDDE